jgi:hypothetical protein
LSHHLRFLLLSGSVQEHGPRDKPHEQTHTSLSFVGSDSAHKYREARLSEPQRPVCVKVMSLIQVLILSGLTGSRAVGRI